MNDKVLEQIGVTATGGWDWNTKKGCFKQAVPKLENLASVVFCFMCFHHAGKDIFSFDNYAKNGASITTPRLC